MDQICLLTNPRGCARPAWAPPAADAAGPREIASKGRCDG